MSEPWTTKTGTDNAENYVIGGRTDDRGRIIETNTYIAGGVLAEETRVSNDSGAIDVYVDKTWA